MHVEAFFDPQTSTLTYVVSDPATGDAVVIDPVLDYDPNRVTVRQDSNQRVLAHVRAAGLRVHAILETHAHADHLSGAQGLRAALGAPIWIGAAIREVQQHFAQAFDLEIPTDGSQFDRLLTDGEQVALGSLQLTALATPGHTPACMTYVLGGALFTGDTLFMPDFGTGRCDFPAGSATTLFASIQRLYRSFPEDTPVYVGHDYQPGGRALAYRTTIGESKAHNLQVRADTDPDTFVRWRTERDATLALPTLLFPSIQVNVDAGRLPAPTASGARFLKLPLQIAG
jgi:glyoxylase-like metal-dependent hydrolase (beta-lactamase superfamily II)